VSTLDDTLDDTLDYILDEMTTADFKEYVSIDAELQTDEATDDQSVVGAERATALMDEQEEVAAVDMSDNESESFDGQDTPYVCCRPLMLK